MLKRIYLYYDGYQLDYLKYINNLKWLFYMVNGSINPKIDKL